jgi:hypothetical protein
MAVKFWIFCGKRDMTFSCSILTMPEVLRDREPQQAEELEHALRLLKEGSGAARRARARKFAHRTRHRCSVDEHLEAFTKSDVRIGLCRCCEHVYDSSNTK